MTKLEQVIDNINQVREEKGVAVRGGKTYTMVQDRVEALRRVYGDEISIVTEILNDSYEAPVGDAMSIGIIMRASIRVNDVVLATGHACEFWGGSKVNETSAIENAETSCIGRALAALGVHGGEFASANEMDAVGRKTEAKTISKPRTRQGEDRREEKKKDEAIAPEEIEEFKLDFLNKIKEESDLDGLKRLWHDNSKTLERIRAVNPKEHRDILGRVTLRKAELTSLE